MSGRSTRRAVRRSGAVQTLLTELAAARKHNAALSLFLRGAIRAYGGLTNPALTIAKPILDMSRDRIVAKPFGDRVVLSLEPDPAAAAVDEQLPTDTDVPWGT